MPPDVTENNMNHSAKLFGLGKEPKRPGDPLVMTDRTTAWEIYNHKASEVDREMIKDWNDNLNTLLIFTALYSAVLTAFIIESMKLLEENATETTRDILLVVSRQLANSSFPPFEPTAYETPKYAIIVNGLLFTSLSCALIAALLAVLALQWVANYDMGLNTSSPEKRALQRHMRLMGIEKWKMSELIASLPLLIFVALFLFFIGIADWLWHMNRAISGIVIGGIGIGFLLYTITNLISIFKVEAPFRTPISKGLAVFIPFVAQWLQNVLTNLLSTIRAHAMSDQDAVHTRKQQLTFTKREENIFDGIEKGPIALDGLLWLVNHVEISSTSRDTFIALIKGLTEVPAPLLMNEEKIEDVPWKAIFEMLCSPYIEKDEYKIDELDNAMWIGKGMGIIPYFESRTFERFFEYLRNSNDRSITGIAYFASYKQKHNMGLLHWEVNGATQICRAFEHTSESISQIGYNYLHFMLLNTKKEWPGMGRWEHICLVNSMVDAWTIPSAVIRDGSSPISLPTRSIQLIIDFVIPGAEVDAIDIRYLAAIQPSGIEWQDDDWNDALCRVLRMVTQHLTLQVSHKYDSLSNFTKELKIFSSLMDSKRLDLVEEKDNFIRSMLNKTTGKTNDEQDRIGNILCEGLYSRPFEVVWVDLILAMDEFVTRLDPHSFHFYSNAIWLINTLVKFHFDLDASANLNALAQVRDPCLAWIAVCHCPDDFQFQAFTHPNFSEWNTIIEQEVIRVFDSYLHLLPIVSSDARIRFLRALILDGPSNARIKALNLFRWGYWPTSYDERWHRLFACPVLGVILEQSVKSEEFPIRSILTQMAKFQWFYDELSQANGLDWLPLIAFNAIHGEDIRFLDNALAEILVNHILSSAANQEVIAPLSCSYHYLQSMGQCHNSSDHHRLANLRVTFVWVLNNSIKVHDSQDTAESSAPLLFDPPILEREDWPTVGDVRSFDFVNDMSDEEWDDWVTRLKVMIMGVSLGGLKPGPLQDRNRFCRDPDGLCGRL
ncbi:hypothetical protein CPB86DRAFT_874976 [Serendipita vermifera]|nr:hypothetical protein CPB86DRAFT_874976 [Serendipita vermifera]